MTSTPFTAAQREIITNLGSTAADRPEFDDDLRERLRDDLQERLAPLSSSYSPDDPLRVNKHNLAMVHGCEARFVHEADTDDFDWTVPIAIGSIAHKAIELSVHWRANSAPLELVDEAIARISGEDYSLGNWLRERPESDRAQLRSEVNDKVAAFLECWPPLKPQWRPVTESRVRAEFLGGRIVAAGKVDLTLGQARGQQAGKVIIDLKSGQRRVNHIDDLRFYALLEALKIGTPPRLAATYYLDQGRYVPEAITEDVLYAAMERLIAGVELMVELLVDRRETSRRPSNSCRWCPLLDSCTTGQDFLRVDDGEGP